MKLETILAENLEHVRFAATALAARYGGNRARDLRHIAMDAQAAMDGCEASLASVREWLADDHELLMSALASAEYVEAMDRAEIGEAA